MIIDTLNFIKGSIANKDLVPELQHVQIKDGRITGFNGTLSLSAPVDLPDVVPKADTFIKAVNTAAEIDAEATVTLNEGRMKISAGTFTAYIECLTEWETGLPGPSGKKQNIKADIIPVLKKLLPFISQDASRPWSRGILFRGTCAYVTNNICLVQMYTGARLPFEAVVPIGTIKEMLRIKEEPNAISFDGNTLTFYYEKDRWLKSCIIDGSWPDIEKMLNDIALNDGEQFPENFFDNLSKLVPFLGEDKSVFFNDGLMSTSEHEKVGTNFKIDLPYKMRFNGDQLLLLEKVASKIDFASYPKPCTFFGDKLRGLIMGMVW